VADGTILVLGAMVFAAAGNAHRWDVSVASVEMTAFVAALRR
jgi:hypothetical protein